MEQYLIDMGVIEDEKYLKSETDIVSYFEDLDSSDLGLEFGQGYYEDAFEKIVKIEDRFYRVTGEVEVTSSKQEYGDRLYWMDKVSYVNFEEITKPTPPVKYEYMYELVMTDEQKERLENVIHSENIEVIGRTKWGNGGR